VDLSPGIIAFTPILLAVLAFLVYRYYNRWRSNRISTTPLPEHWLAYLSSEVPPYSRLSPEEQARLRQRMKAFLADKTFYGCAGLEITDEMRVTIAAEACLLILNHTGPVYPGLTSILVYPSAFVANREVQLDNGTVTAAAHGLLGESWDLGKVILSWDDVVKGVADFSDGHNVVLHEFAHQLDTQSGGADGAPPLRGKSYRSWARVLSSNYEDLQSRVAQHKKTVLDAYATTNPAEFFAVATETFFERPRALRDRRPDLYEELKSYYRVDPLEWRDDAGQGD
jgi:Mlc titration factor MtfA (ptsG expression regulator)